MSVLKDKFMAGMVVLAVLATACDQWVEDWDDDELYADPNQPVEVSIDQLMTAVQVSSFFFLEGQLSRTAAIWTQQMSGTDRQFIGLGQFDYNNQDWGNEWFLIHGGGGLIDIREIYAKAEAQDRSHYAGIGKIWEAVIIGMSASMWGDIPYTEAANPNIMEPVFDDMADIYADLHALLDEAIADLSVTDGGTGPGGNDFIYGGDTESWIDAAYTLKARLYMHWAEADPANYALALAAANNGISSLDGSFRTRHGESVPEATGWSQFLNQRSGYISGGGYLIRLLESLSDPRLNIYFANAADTNIVIGSDPGDANTAASSLNPDYYGAPEWSFDVLSYEENQLIIAECENHAGNDAAALAALNNVRTALEEKWGLSAGTYPPLTGLTGDVLKDAILEEKYISLFLNMEVYNDYKRTCYPYDLTDYTWQGDDLPSRLLYAQREHDTNSNTPTDPTRNDNDPNACP
ncbi:MAG: SusD/RagB family nutrient-binding outer membrane lipoprotein [Fidelibacterota bacterium]|nr:MAG: SusD/RagB family nutrient-binding outer membrane lipoprotein [Candidatus Neomarinimicrobiota bacterium]